MPLLQCAARRHAPGGAELRASGFEVLFISTDRPELLHSSLKDQTVTYTLLSDPELRAELPETLWNTLVQHGFEKSVYSERAQFAPHCIRPGALSGFLHQQRHQIQHDEEVIGGRQIVRVRVNLADCYV